VTVLAALLVGAQPRIAADVGAVLGRALQDVRGQREHANEAQHQDDRPEDAEEERRVGGGEHASEGTPDAAKLPERDELDGLDVTLPWA
jgi:hypothetical protein